MHTKEFLREFQEFLREDCHCQKSCQKFKEKMVLGIRFFPEMCFSGQKSIAENRLWCKIRFCRQHTVFRVGYSEEVANLGERLVLEGGLVKRNGFSPEQALQKQTLDCMANRNVSGPILRA